MSNVRIVEVTKEDFVIDEEVVVKKLEICKCNSLVIYTENGDIQSVHLSNINKFLDITPEEIINQLKLTETEQCKRCVYNIGLDTCSCLNGKEFFRCDGTTEVCNLPAQKHYQVYKIRQNLFR